ncbi:hypothetical protein KSD_73550 [Ktedonobacter sp. SOSP1-85]|nr:hypothetical protein KSD_73550 [Ktedonobacter sp. SOSP1-85]
MVVLSCVRFFLPPRFRVERLLFLDSFADFFAKPTSRLRADIHAEKLFKNPARMAKRHPTP